MPEKRLTVVQVLSLLTETPTRIGSATDGLSSKSLRAAPAPGEWSTNEVLAHLRSCADVWGAYMARILVEDHPTIRASSPRAEVNRKDYPELDFKKSFRAFAKQRADLLGVLASLSPQQWSRSATVTGAGRPRQSTVHSYAQRLAIHERAHVKQIERAIASRARHEQAVKAAATRVLASDKELFDRLSKS